MGLKPLKVSDVNRYIKKIISDDPILKNIRIEGEISNFKLHYSGHMYFTLKDDKSKLKCVMFNGYSKNLNIKIENGMNVIITGYISVYENDGSYQLYATNIEAMGIGDLYVAFEKLKNKLEKEGLFDASKKKSIPFLPMNIGVVTSSTGAAVKDIITVIKRRMPSTNIYIYPVLVQGSKAHMEICNGLNYFNSRDDIDIIITGRGGGSIEELWAFNEEDVARMIYSLDKPVISAVGHETDFTISDFVSDLRAPTPSAAGELAVPLKVSLEDKLNLLYKNLTRISINCIKNRRLSLENIKYKSELLRNPHQLIDQKKLHLDNLFKELSDSTQKHITKRENTLINLGIKLDALSPLKILSRGYSIVNTLDNKIIKSIDNTNINENISITLYDGNIEAKVLKKEYNKNIGGDYENNK